MVAACSSGNAVELFHLCYQHKAGQHVVHTRGLGAMGFGIPAAIGACLAAGRRRTICLDGDGGFQLNIQELETVARLKLPIKFFVINNNGYASIRISQAAYFQGRLCGADPSSGVTLPDHLTLLRLSRDVPRFLQLKPPSIVEALWRILALFQPTWPHAKGKYACNCSFSQQSGSFEEPQPWLSAVVKLMLLEHNFVKEVALVPDRKRAYRLSES